MANPGDPLMNSYPIMPPTFSLKTFYIAGIVTDVYGFEEIPKDCKSISCLWLLNPRNGTKERMAPLAYSCIADWQKQRPSDSKVGLIAVAFDQRNHGSRNVYQLANESWREGNETHAQDMFSIFNGTALDVSLIMDHLGSYIFHGPGALPIEQHLVAGVSLGGHAAWQIFFNEPRVTAVVVIIGCPDYASIMKDRARLSKRKSYLSSNGADFFSSEDFPKALIVSVQKSDPKGQLFGSAEVQVNPSETEQRRLRTILDPKIKNKKLLLCSGGADKLVPYHCGAPFIQFLKAASDGWYKDGNVYVEDKIYPKAGHEFTPEMVKDTTRFISDAVASTSVNGRGPSKI